MTRRNAGNYGGPNGIEFVRGTNPGDQLVWNPTGTGLWETTPGAVITVGPMAWAPFIALVNAAAAVGNAVQMGPGLWTADVPGLLANGAHVIGGPGVVINSTMPAT